MSELILYTYYRSSAAYRVRIALNLKGLTYRPHYVHLLRNGGEHRQPDYLAINPQGLVPCLIDNGVAITQSLAIIEYLDEVYPHPPLLPSSPKDRAYVRSLAQLISCDIHPINNLRIGHYLKQRLHVTDELYRDWYQHWVAEGFNALETRLTAQASASEFCYGDTPTVADLCLIPQVYNARRFDCDLSAYPRILAIEAYCLKLAEFELAAPEQQPDAEERDVRNLYHA